ncbi:hypothetical protein GCM10022221_77720 [Actinocorallia aurea]
MVDAHDGPEDEFGAVEGAVGLLPGVDAGRVAEGGLVRVLAGDEALGAVVDGRPQVPGDERGLALRDAARLR